MQLGINICLDLAISSCMLMDKFFFFFFLTEVPLLPRLYFVFLFEIYPSVSSFFLILCVAFSALDGTVISLSLEGVTSW